MPGEGEPAFGFVEAVMTTLGPRTINELFGDLTYRWGRLPQVGHEIDSWDELQQLDFVMEWPIQEDGLEILCSLMTSGTPTPEQRRRYTGLLRLVEQNRPIFDALWKGEPVPDIPEQPQSPVGG
jgi:hypothetical protein